MRIYLLLIVIIIVLGVNAIVFFRHKKALETYDDILEDESQSKIDSKLFFGTEFEDANKILQKLQLEQRREAFNSAIGQIYTYIMKYAKTKQQSK